MERLRHFVAISRPWWLALPILLVSCSEPQRDAASPRQTTDEQARRTSASSPRQARPGPVPHPSDTEQRPFAGALRPSMTATEGEAAPRSFADLLSLPDDPSPRRRWSHEQLSAAGLRRIESRHVTLYTDLPADAEVDVLPDVFDHAVPLWAEYFGIAPEQTAEWRLNAFLMQDHETFAALGMLPRAREIRTGFATKDNLWMNEQTSPYYRRHLWLHEGTHAFMHAMLGRAGPGWYMEGVAELLGTHRIEDGQLKIGVMPRASEEVPGLGRVELVQLDVDSGKVHAIEDIMQLDNRRALPSDAYAWCWALARFLDTHPRYRDRFRTLGRSGQDATFDEHFREAPSADWHELQTEWAVFASTLDYNHQVEPTVLDFQPGEKHLAAGTSIDCEIRADRGWQNSGIMLEADTTYRITAQGRYQVNDDPQVWWCEPNGITIHYNRGRPLGVLLGALLTRGPDGQPHAASLIHPVEIGLETTVTPVRSGTLYLRINDAPGDLHNNRGEIAVNVYRE